MEKKKKKKKPLKGEESRNNTRAKHDIMDDDDDDDDDLEEEDEEDEEEEEEMKSALRRDVDALLSRIEGLNNNAKGDALMTDGQLKMELESIERERERIGALMMMMNGKKKKKKKKKKSENDEETRRGEEENFLLARFDVVRGASSSVAEYLDSTVRNVARRHALTRDKHILKELDEFVDKNVDSIETNTIRMQEVDKEKENRREWVRRFGIESMIGLDREEEQARAEQALRALEINSSGKSSGRNVVKSSNDIIDGERNVNMLLKDTNAKEEEDLEKAIEKNVLSSVDSAIKSLETAGMAIAKANKNNKESSAAAASFAMAISNFSALPVWQKRVVGLLVFLVFSWILILSAMNNDEKSEFEEIDQTIATTADASAGA